MSEKSKKTKEADVVDDIPEEEVGRSKAKDKKSDPGKSDGLMAKATAVANNPRKRGVDPILAVSAIVFALACLIVIGNSVYDNVIADHTEPCVEYNDNIKVDYIGCYNNFYDASNPNNGAVIFDTSLRNLNSDVPTSYEYNPAFNPLTFKAGTDTSLLQKFQDAVIGFRPGQTTTVMIPAADGYGALSASQKLPLPESVTIDTVCTFASAAAYKEVFDRTAPTTGTEYIDCYTSNMNDSVDSTPYGFAAYVTTNPNGTVTVRYIAEVDEEFDYVMNDYVQIHVTEADDYSITFSYVIQQDAVTKDKMSLVKAFVDDKIVYIKLKQDGSVDYYKTTDEKTGEDLYFTITVLGYVDA